MSGVSICFTRSQWRRLFLTLCRCCMTQYNRLNYSTNSISVVHLATLVWTNMAYAQLTRWAYAQICGVTCLPIISESGGRWKGEDERTMVQITFSQCFSQCLKCSQLQLHGFAYGWVFEAGTGRSGRWMLRSNPVHIACWYQKAMIELMDGILFQLGGIEHSPYSNIKHD